MASGRDSHLFRHGGFSNWTAYRYGGESKPVTLAGPKPKAKAKLSKAKREHIVHRVIERMRDWQSSPFEHEGPLTHGLREAFCLDGIDWRQSDEAASGIVAEALRMRGAVRPSWGEGQRHHTISPDFCVWCLGEIDEENRTRGQRFCSVHCAKTAYEAMAAEDVSHVDTLRRAARRMVLKETFPPRPCAYCGKAFKSENPEARFCSLRCARREQAGERLLPEIHCQACGTLFKPKNRGAKFCSPKCSQPAVRLAKVIELSTVTRLCGCCAEPFTPTTDHALYCSPRCSHVMASRAYAARNYVPSVYHRVCEWCEAPFEAKMPWATFCCREHREAAKAVLKPSRRPRPLAPPVFDYVFRRAA